MSKWLSLLLFSTLLFSLELSVQSGKESSQNFSVIHLKENKPFLCESQQNDFDDTVEVICAFNQRPSELLKPLNNNFFTISSQTRGKNYFIIIKPHQKMRLYPIIFDLTQDQEIYHADVISAKHWMVVGYKEQLPMIKHDKTPSQGFNFPVHFDYDAKPYVGGLDIKGNPVHMSSVKDVSDYIALKRFYRAKDYRKALEISKAVLETYPDTVFRSELLLYQIRSQHHLEKNEELLEVAKKFLRTYSSDENVPEVLAYTANAYALIGLYIDADYFFDRLFTEHQDNHFAKLGLIFKAEQLEATGNSKKALTFYEQAMHESQDMHIAATAAYKLANYYIEHGQVKKAKIYAEKILKSYSVYFGEHILTSIGMANAFANRKQPEIAAGIADALLKSMQKGQLGYEKLYKNKGVWLADSGQKAEALEAFNAYLMKYKFGNFREEVIREKDALFFDDDDQNATSKLAEYQGLMEQYSGDAIGNKATYKKAELLYAKGNYPEVLDMRSALEALDPGLYPDTQKLIKDAAVGMMERALEKDACTDVIALSQEFDVKLSSKWDAGIFSCAKQSGEYELAKSIAQPHLKDADVGDRMAWLSRYIEADFGMGNYQDVITASDELLTLNAMEKEDYRYIHRLRYDAYQRLGKSEGMIKAITEVERAYGLDFKDIERYTQMVTLAQRQKSDTLIENYSNKVIALQNKTNTRTQSPYIEFTLVQSLIDLNKTEKALQVVRSLEKIKLSNEKRARQKYLEGTLLQKLSRNSEAKKAYEESMEADAASAWGKLANDSLELL
ncbi:MAG: flagellar protein [Campylobacterota bacterium]|nr:flagellar protein [Campylobacterota bacterium]